jgi:DNA polymerase-3 subunit epsilon
VRELVLDIETTGLSAKEGHKIVEVACIELEDYELTGSELHFYCNPNRDIPEKATEIHGLTWDYLKQYPTFDKQINKLLEFIGNDPLVIHNASFDVNFLNWEMKNIQLGEISFNRVIDTLPIARRKFPKVSNTLDALCKRFDIDLSNRICHGALIDVVLLAQVYVRLLGKEQNAFDLTSLNTKTSTTTDVKALENRKRLSMLTDLEEEAHRAFIEDQIPNSIWQLKGRQRAR